MIIRLPVWHQTVHRDPESVLVVLVCTKEWSETGVLWTSHGLCCWSAAGRIHSQIRPETWSSEDSLSMVGVETGIPYLTVVLSATSLYKAQGVTTWSNFRYIVNADSLQKKHQKILTNTYQVAYQRLRHPERKERLRKWMNFEVMIVTVKL